MNREERIKLAIERGYTCNPETGDIFGIKGKLIKAKSDNGYIYFGVKDYLNNKIWMKGHQFVYYWVNKEVVDCIDHINGVKCDNRIENLRSVTNQENQFNINKILAKSGYMGVSKYKSRSWRARIMLNGKDICLGHYDTPELASEAYQAAKLKYHIIGDAHAGN